MKYKKESLEKLLFLIEEICLDKENDWFSKKLVENLLGNRNYSVFNETADLPSFFRLLKKHFKIKAFHFYSNIYDEKLRSELTKDCVKMYWYQINNDVESMFIHAYFQMENMLNYYVSNTDAYQRILNNPTKYIYNNRNFTVDCYTNFFYNDVEKPLVNISIWSKLAYWAMDSNKYDFLLKNHKNFSILINIRNDNIHKSSTFERKTDSFLIDFKKFDYSAFSYYINAIKTIASTLPFF